MRRELGLFILEKRKLERILSVLISIQWEHKDNSRALVRGAQWQDEVDTHEPAAQGGYGDVSNSDTSPSLEIFETQLDTVSIRL